MTATADTIQDTPLTKNFEIRPYQQRIMTKATDSFQGRFCNAAGQLQKFSRSVLIESPTGSGKTVMGWSVAKKLQEEIPDLHVAWYAMRRNLLKQAERENKALGFNVRNVMFMSMFDTNLQPLIDVTEQGKKLLLVFDEAQHDSSPTMASNHNHIKPDFVLGLTATPFRTDRLKLCFDHVIRDAGIHQLIMDGYLSKYHHYTIKKFDVETVFETYIREPKRWGKSIFYFKDLTQCAHLHRLLIEHGVTSEFVTGDSDVETQLKLFSDGRVTCLVNCMKLTEGFDEPTLQTAWVRDSCRGPTMQMAGRVFRKHPSVQFKQVVQSEESEHPMVKTALPSQSFAWDESLRIWKTMKVNEKIDEITEMMLIEVVQNMVPMPEYITNKKKKKKSSFKA